MMGGNKKSCHQNNWSFSAFFSCPGAGGGRVIFWEVCRRNATWGVFQAWYWRSLKGRDDNMQLWKWRLFWWSVSCACKTSGGRWRNLVWIMAHTRTKTQEWIWKNLEFLNLFFFRGGLHFSLWRAEMKSSLYADQTQRNDKSIRFLSFVTPAVYWCVHINISKGCKLPLSVSSQLWTVVHSQNINRASAQIQIYRALAAVYQIDDQ